jgi:hypothetical protein
MISVQDFLDAHLEITSGCALTQGWRTATSRKSRRGRSKFFLDGLAVGDIGLVPWLC